MFVVAPVKFHQLNYSTINSSICQNHYGVTFCIIIILVDSSFQDNNLSLPVSQCQFFIHLPLVSGKRGQFSLLICGRTKGSNSRTHFTLNFPRKHSANKLAQCAQCKQWQNGHRVVYSCYYFNCLHTNILCGCGIDDSLSSSFTWKVEDEKALM